MSPNHSSARERHPANQSGQAAVELALAVSLLLILICASIDFGRALNYAQGLVEMTRQGSMLASRGDTLTQAAKAVMAGESSLDMANSGKVIITAVTNNKNVNTITGQVVQGTGGSSCNGGCDSQIGSGVGSTATVPAAAAGTLQQGQTIYVTEVYYSFQPVTAVGNLTSVVLPSTLYEAAYF